MRFIVRPSSLAGTVPIPASKSHTIRSVVIASLAEGVSVLKAPLRSADTEACVRACRALGAEIDVSADEWTITGVAGEPHVAADVIDVGNSGTTLYLAMGAAALAAGYTVFTGDEQIRRRLAQPLLSALTQLGVEAFSTRGNGTPPVVIRGPLHGGRCRLDGSKTSQYVSSLLLSCPLASGDTEIHVLNPVEHPYLEMTLRYLRDQGVAVAHNESFETFRVPGGGSYHRLHGRLPADFSSATFFLCAAAVTGSELTLAGLDMNDIQGDKAVVDMLETMGARVDRLPAGLRIRGGTLRGAELDLNATPDALPALAVTACFAEGETRLVNVAQARLKETDRIRVMSDELTRMGGRIQERPDGLVIRGRPLRGARVHGHHDHRVVMALAVAGLAAAGETHIDTAEAAAVTFPDFARRMQTIGADIQVVDAETNPRGDGIPGTGSRS